MNEEFRLRVGNKIFRPGSREEIEKLYKAGRIFGSDSVSVLNGPWISLAQFFAQRVAPPAPAPTRTPSSPSEASYERPTLKDDDEEQELVRQKRPRGPMYRVLRGNKVFGPMNKEQLDNLLESGRITRRDLVCLDSGQWVQLTEVLEVLEADDILHARDVEVEYEDEEPEIEMLVDDWQVVVGTIPSAAMQKMHIWELLAAKEITLESMAHHRHWPEQDWRPIHKIAELVRYIEEQREKYD